MLLKGITMKRLFVIAALALLSAIFTPAKSQVDVSVFYSPLSQYGEWVDCSYGHVWRPLDVEQGWRPYMYGRWAWTDNGWYWVSDEPFGWATFHYGRWVYDDYYGWLWVPDDVWGPSWVEWRYDDDYVGWAPLPPIARYSVSAGISFDVAWSAPYHYWSFVPSRNFTSTRLVDYVQPVERTRRIFGATHSVRAIAGGGDRIVNRGIDVAFVERRTRSTVVKIDIDARTTGSGERFVQGDGHQRIEVYRPRFNGEVHGAAPRVDEKRVERQAPAVIQREHPTHRHVEVERNAPERREPMQKHEPRKDDRQVEPQHPVRMHEQRQNVQSQRNPQQPQRIVQNPQRAGQQPQRNPQQQEKIVRNPQRASQQPQRNPQRTVQQPQRNPQRQQPNTHIERVPQPQPRQQAEQPKKDRK